MNAAPFHLIPQTRAVVHSFGIVFEEIADTESNKIDLDLIPKIMSLAKGKKHNLQMAVAVYNGMIGENCERKNRWVELKQCAHMRSHLLKKEIP